MQIKLSLYHHTNLIQHYSEVIIENSIGKYIHACITSLQRKKIWLGYEIKYLKRRQNNIIILL